MNAAGGFPVEVECTNDPNGDDVFVDFMAGTQVVETDEDLWGFSPSFTFQLTAGTYSLKARCRDTAGNLASPNMLTWNVQVGSPSSAPTPANRAPVVEWSTPVTGSYDVGVGDGFEVEIECEEPDGDSVFVDFLANGQVIETDQDFVGTSPSFSFQFSSAGTFALAARCRDELGALGPEVTWTVRAASAAQAPATSLADGSPTSDVCLPTSDPSGYGTPESKESRRVSALLIQSPDVWHRTGAWTCELASLAEPVQFALELDSELVSFKTTLEDYSAFDYSAWDLLVSIQPGFAPTWIVFETLLPILQACSTALDGIESFVDVRIASIAFLQNPTDATLANLKQVLASATTAYSAWVNAFDSAAAEVAALSLVLAGLASDLQSAATEIAAGTWFPFRDTVVDIIATLASYAASAALEVQSWADAIRALADPIREDQAIIHAALNPPNSAGAPALAPVILVLAIMLASLVTRRRMA